MAKHFTVYPKNYVKASRNWREKTECKTKNGKIVRMQNVSNIFNDVDYYVLYDANGNFVEKSLDFNDLHDKLYGIKASTNRITASSGSTGKWQVYYYEPLFMDRYDHDNDWSDRPRTPEGSSRYAVYDGKKVIVDTFDTELEAEKRCRWGMDYEYPDGTPFTVDFNYEQI